MLDLRRDAILLPVRRHRPHAMRTDRHNLLHLRLLQRLQTLLRETPNNRSFPSRRAGSPVHFSFFSTPKLHPQESHHPRKIRNNLAPLRVITPHASQPQTVLLRAIEDRKLLLRNKLVALRRAHPQRIPLLLQRQKKLRPIRVFPRARIHRAAPQPNKTANAESPPGTETRKPRKSCTQTPPPSTSSSQNPYSGLAPPAAPPRSPGPICIQIRPHPQNNLFRVQHLPRRRRRAVLRAPPALHAAISLQRNQLRQILARHQPKILIPLQLRNLRKPMPLQENRQRTQHQMQMLRMRNQRQKHQQRQRMRPPQRLHRHAAIAPQRTPPDTSPSAERSAPQSRPTPSETFAPSHSGLTKNRRTNSPAIHTATSSAHTAANTK